MSKKKIFCLIFAVVLLLGVITVNAASANIIKEFYCYGNMPSPDYYYLYGNTWFTLNHSDMRTGIFTYESRKWVDHNQFACAAGYRSMTMVDEHRSAGDNYSYRIANPEQGANYGGSPTYTFIQSATFSEGSWGMNSTVKMPIKTTGAIGDTWCKDETVVWGYTRQPFVQTVNNILEAQRR